MRFLQLPEMLKNAPMFKAAKKAAAAANPGRQPVRAGGSLNLLSLSVSLSPPPLSASFATESCDLPLRARTL